MHACSTQLCTTCLGYSYLDYFNDYLYTLKLRRVNTKKGEERKTRRAQNRLVHVHDLFLSRSMKHMLSRSMKHMLF
jgi:hypothetical protein